jgi:hypothetical protein
MARRFRSGTNSLTPPTMAVFAFSILLALLALLSEYGSARIPYVGGREFLTMTIAWGLLVAGALFRGI